MAVGGHIPCPMLEQYVLQREPWLDRIRKRHSQGGKPVNKDQAKKLLLKILNGGKYDSWMKGDWDSEDKKYTNPVSGDMDPMILRYEQEIVGITKTLIQKNPELFNSIDKKQNREGSFMSIYLQEFERRLLEEVYKFLQNKGVIKNNDCVLCFDGIMVLIQRVEDVKRLCADLQTHILDTTGFDIVFERKTFDKAIENITRLEGFNPTVQPIPDELIPSKPMDNFVQVFRLRGDFEHHHGNRFQALGEWRCPEKDHSCCRMFDVFGDRMYCYGCKKVYYPLNFDKEWLENAKHSILDPLRKNSKLKDLFEFEGKKLGKQKREELLSKLEFIPDGEYKLIRGNKCLVMGMEFSDYGGVKIKTPSKVRDILFSSRYTTLDDALNRQQTFHENTIDRPILGNEFTCGKHCPGFEFGPKNKVVPQERDRCKFNVVCEENTIAMCLPMASGKTHALVEHLSRNGYNKILVVVGRTSFGDKIHRDLKQDLEIEFYKYVKSKGQKVKRLVCQVDSLHRFEQDWDVIIIDEIVTVLVHFGAKTFKKSRIVFELLRGICRDVPKLIVMDADMDKTDHVEWFLKSCGRSVTKIKSNAKTDCRLYLKLSDSDDFYNRISSLIRKGYKVGITSNTKSEIKAWRQRLEKEFPDKKGLALYNEDGHRHDAMLIDGEVRKFDEKEDTKNLDWFAFSPSMAPGCSITDPFDVLCAHAMVSDMVAGARYWQQMLHRIRNLRKNLVLHRFDIKTNILGLSTKFEDIKDSYDEWISDPDLAGKCFRRESFQYQ